MTTTDTATLRARADAALTAAHRFATSNAYEAAERESEARRAVALAQYAEVLLRLAADEAARAAKGAT
jgi:hypothetical protein